eukprot:MONOS_12547.1-p1 / transcript=MONOS_12547.1 / gene=MONOS_12547 / organism=Monocercomonoides_exilis_PA203 / gene_product=unspecified product / transcript_product=unspecified product / location=Mono_scaffold00701:5059-5349(+) / protein_length=97 / sequence_SO=supercontig / SO=protein_coding / is_pseudo=false
MDPVDDQHPGTLSWRRKKVGDGKRKEGYESRESGIINERMHSEVIRSWGRRRCEKRKEVKETRLSELRREKSKRNSFVTELLIPTTLASENTPHNS